MAALAETRDVSDWARHVAKTGSDLGEMQMTTRSTSGGGKVELTTHQSNSGPGTGCKYHQYHQ
jgi:hypothetical protein